MKILAIALSLLASACLIEEDPFQPTDGPVERRVLISPDPVAVVEGQSSNVMVSLDAAPSGVASVTIASGDESLVSVNPPSLVFSAGDFDQPQVVTIAALHDVDVADNTVAVTASTPGYTSATTMVIGSDDDTLMIVTQPAGTTPIALAEGSSMPLMVSLSAQPAANVTVNVARLGTEVTVAPGILTFTPASFDTGQLVSIHGVIDADTTDDTDMLVLTSTGLATVNIPVEVVDLD